MNRLLISGGIGDIILTLLSIQKYSDKYNIKFNGMLCAKSQFNTARKLVEIILSNSIDSIQLEEIEDDEYLSLKNNFEEISNFISIGPYIIFNNQWGNVFLFWPGYSKSLVEIANSSPCWPDVYSKFLDIDSFSERFRFSAHNHEEAESLFVSFSANSIKMEMISIRKHFYEFLYKCKNIKKIYLHVPKYLRPDLKEQKMDDLTWMQSIDYETILFDGEIDSMVSMLRSRRMTAFILRSGLLELLAILKVPTVCIYPSRSSYDFYKLTSQEQDSIYNIHD